ncbi:MAG: hypothetical protein LC789_07260 [Actinobacteria bacterium]|nr:hypothetical protein [Actinomycetota bacterium]MCA1720276.1 hypothetical protein [Actinomycetota bacterium]
MKQIPRRLAVLFLLALIGVLAAIGLVLGAVAGSAVGVGYAVVVVLGLLAATVAAKRRVRAVALAEGRTCTCCTGTVHDPVQVI